MRVAVTLVYEYIIPDDLEEREEAYGTQSVEEAVEIDLQYPEDIVDFGTLVHSDYEIIGE